MTKRFFFHVFNDNTTSADEAGMPYESINAAFHHAAKIALELSVDEDDWGTAVEVCDATGSPLAWFCAGKHMQAEESETALATH